MTDDMYDWERQTPKFRVNVLAGIYVWDVTADGSPVVTCGFLESDKHQLSLPSMALAFETHTAHTAIALFREYVAVDPRMLDIVPYGFFDPIRPQLDDQDMQNRAVCVYYKTKIHPGTPVHPDLRFLTNDEIDIARTRIARGHYEAYRGGLGS